MTKLLELQKAVANRNFEHDAIDEDLEFVEDQFDAFRKYFNAVYEDICAGETAKVLLSSGRWTTEQYQDKIVSDEWHMTELWTHVRFLTECVTCIRSSISVLISMTEQQLLIMSAM